MRPRKERAGEAKDGERVLVVNRQARFRFELLDRWQAGLVLLGSEVKSLRAGTVDLSDAYVRFSRDEAWLANCRIGPYAHASVDAHEPLRDRKLLLHRREIDRLS